MRHSGSRPSWRQHKDKIDPKVIKTAIIKVVVFDTTIVSVALHTLAQDWNTTVATIQWVSTGYLPALGVAVPLSTWALGPFGGKWVWMFALVVFLVGSPGSRMAWNVSCLSVVEDQHQLFAQVGHLLTRPYTFGF
ncbi:hypothetical protein AAGW05_12600 [Arthrobacter sp. LAPM80]|uniref:hypothetical protein n=1 Tax=Arthrobacter sp. LAPM80 TaxID=3141788 RepID=UPI00398B0992